MIHQKSAKTMKLLSCIAFVVYGIIINNMIICCFDACKFYVINTEFHPLIFKNFSAYYFSLLN